MLDIDEIINELKIDCSHCDGLCCVALYFSKIDGFPENKPAGQPCHHLLNNNQCDIYKQLKEKKMKGCMIYDCFGAGQLVSKHLPSWRTYQKKSAVFDVFQNMIFLQQILYYLISAYEIKATSQLEQLIKENIKVRKEVLKNETIHLETFRQKATQYLKKICQQYDHDLSMQILITKDFKGQDLHDYVFLGSDLRDAHFEDADLSQSLFLTQMQLNSCYGNKNTKIPVKLSRPRTWEEE